MELTKAVRKRFASLATNKGRREFGMFMAEGTKCVLETINHFCVEAVLATSEWLDSNATSVPSDTPLVVARKADLNEISALTASTEVIAIYHIPEPTFRPPVADELCLALDRVQDPGNLGTIVRIASWMGVKDIYCSEDTVDLYNPKVVQATMGAIARVRVHYVSLPAILDRARHDGVPVYGTFLDGQDIYATELSDGGVVVMGNEGSGIGYDVARQVDRRILIPSWPPGVPTIESLNVSVATAITLAEFRRRLFNS